MERINKYKYIGKLLLLCTLSVVLVLQSCKKKDDPIPKMKEVEDFLIGIGVANAEWKSQSVTVNSKDESAMYKDLKLSFSAGTFTSSGGVPVWPVSGTWKFKDDTAEKVIRGDGVEITILEISSKKFKCSFQWDKFTIGSARETSLSGLHIFTFTR